MSALAIQLHKQQLQTIKEMKIWVVPMTRADQILHSSRVCGVLATTHDGTVYQCDRVCAYFQQHYQGRVPVCNLHAYDDAPVYPSIIRSRM
jgi:hypothetical protein